MTRGSLVERAQREISASSEATARAAVALVAGQLEEARREIVNALAYARTAHEAAAAVDHREVIRSYKASMVVLSALGEALEHLVHVE